MTGSEAPSKIEAGPEPSRVYSSGRAWLARWLRIPIEPPSIPPGSRSWARSFRPAESYLRHLKLRYVLAWGFVGLFLVPLALLTLTALTADGHGLAAALLALLVVLPGLLWIAAGYWAIRLKFDTTWYVMTDRAIRVRSGIWVIRESTVTFENAQNVRVRRGPLQRWLGIGDVTIETAAVGSVDQHGTTTASTVVVAGVDDPRAVRDRIIERMRLSRATGLGDEPGDRPRAAPTALDSTTVDAPSSGATSAWSPAHLEALREIRLQVARLGSSTRSPTPPGSGGVGSLG